jgi:Sulfotransferase domain
MLRDPVDRLYSHYQMHFVQDEGVASLETLLNRELRQLRHFGLSHAPDVPAPTTLSSSQEAMFNNETTIAMFEVPNITKSYRDEKDSITFRGFGNHGDYLRLLYRGMYYFQLERWLKYFQLGDNLLVIPYEQFKKDPQSVMQQVYKFVGAASSFQLTQAQLKATYRPAIDQKNRNDMMPAQPLAPRTRRYLEHFYRPYNERLYGLLGEDWRGAWEHKDEP